MNSTASGYFPQYANLKSASKSSAMNNNKPASVKSEAPSSTDNPAPAMAVSLPAAALSQAKDKAPPAIKREAQEPPEPVSEKPGASQQKRAKLFGSLVGKARSATEKAMKTSITSPDDLSDYELKECYEIVRSAMAAQFGHRKVNPTVMEDFLADVFEKGWNPLDCDPPIMHDMETFPFVTQHHKLTKGVIGTIMINREAVNVSHFLTIAVTDAEVSIKMEVAKPKKAAPYRQVLSPAELRRVRWKPTKTIEGLKKQLRKHALNQLVNKIAGDNHDRARDYARNMLHHQTLGNAMPAPCSGRYEFANLAVALNALPLLEHEELEEGQQTVVLFSQAELSPAFRGKTALKGADTLKIGTG